MNNFDDFDHIPYKWALVPQGPLPPATEYGVMAQNADGWHVLLLNAYPSDPQERLIWEELARQIDAPVETIRVVRHDSPEWQTVANYWYGAHLIQEA